MKRRLLLLTILAIAGCSPDPALPEHSALMSSLEPKSGNRVEIRVNTDISEADCINLIKHYRPKGSPDGQVSVHKPSKVLKGRLAPWCVDNFDGTGIFFNRAAF